MISGRVRQCERHSMVDLTTATSGMATLIAGIPQAAKAHALLEDRSRVGRKLLVP